MLYQQSSPAGSTCLTNASFAVRDEVKIIERFSAHIIEEQLRPHRVLDEDGHLAPSQLIRHDIDWLMDHTLPRHDRTVREEALRATRAIVEKIAEVVEGGRAPIPDPFDPPGTSYAPVRSGPSAKNQAAGDELLSRFAEPIGDGDIGLVAAKELALSLEAMRRGGWYSPGADLSKRLEEALGDLIERYRDERPDKVGGAWGANLSECMRAWEAVTGKTRESYEWVKMRYFL